MSFINYHKNKKINGFSLFFKNISAGKSNPQISSKSKVYAKLDENQVNRSSRNINEVSTVKTEQIERDFKQKKNIKTSLKTEDKLIVTEVRLRDAAPSCYG